MERYLVITGSDGNLYKIEQERTDHRNIKFSVIPISRLVDEQFCKDNSQLDISTKIVEDYIKYTKAKYAPNFEQLIQIQSILSSAKVDNYFDYITVLNEVLPKLNRLLQ